MLKNFCVEAFECIQRFDANIRSYTIIFQKNESKKLFKKIIEKIKFFVFQRYKQKTLFFPT
jgi:hypothetical protein